MPEVIYLVATILFALRIALLSIGAQRERSRRILPTNLYRPSVSVVIPARNEEKNIAECLHSIAQSHYPVNCFEIIVVNDRSNDNTGKIVENVLLEIPNLKVVTLTLPRNQGNLQGKPGALDAGIRASSGEVILMTDADCLVSPDWIEAISSQFIDPKVGITASFTTIYPNNFFEKMQAVEWTLTHSMAQAGVGLRQPLGCFGNNLAIRRSVYEALGGYAGIRFSVTEDLALLQAVFAAGCDVRYVCHESAAVQTKPCATFSEYLLQHQRWAKGGLGLGWRAVLFVLLSASLAISLAAAIIAGDYLLLPLIIAIRAAGDTAIIYPSLKMLNRNDLRVPAISAVFFLMILEMIIPILSLKPTVKWKGQIFR